MATKMHRGGALGADSPIAHALLDGGLYAAPAAARMAAAGAEWLPLAALRPLADAWDELARRAIEPNIFYEPAFALAAAPLFGTGVGAVLIWSRRHPGRLIGLFPARIEARRYGIGPPVLVGWTHPYAPLGTPLVDRREADEAIGRWLDFVAAAPNLPNRALLPLLPPTGPVATRLAALLAARGGPCVLFDAHRRAALAPTCERAGYLETALPAKKRKELRRQGRRLADQGELAFETAQSPETLGGALADFAALEAGGWKGAAGTAVALDPAIRRFMGTLVERLAPRGQIRIDRLCVDGRPVAAGITLRSGAAAWFWKIAYEEEAARASPGVQLAIALTGSLLADASLTRVDSCATAGHPMIDRLWRERLELADHLVAVDVNPVGFALTRLLETARRAAIRAAKALRDRLR